MSQRDALPENARPIAGLLDLRRRLNRSGPYARSRAPLALDDQPVAVADSALVANDPLPLDYGQDVAPETGPYVRRLQDAARRSLAAREATRIANTAGSSVPGNETPASDQAVAPAPSRQLPGEQAVIPEVGKYGRHLRKEVDKIRAEQEARELAREASLNQGTAGS